MIPPQKAIHYEKYEYKKWESLDAETIVETPVSLTVNGQVWLTFMCTPVNLEAMAVGFLFNEGIIETMDEVEDVRVCEHGDNVDVWLNRSVEQPTSWRRTSGCTGGVTAVDALARVAHPIVWLLQVSANAVLRLLRVKPAPAGMIAYTREDIRHSVAAAEDVGELEEAEEEMLYKVFDFASKEVSAVMVPRPEVVAISVDMPPEEALATVVDSPFTRYRAER